MCQTQLNSCTTLRVYLTLSPIIANRKSQIANRILQIAYCKSHIAYRTLQIANRKRESRLTQSQIRT